MSIGILPNVNSFNRDVSSALSAHCREEQPNKKPKKGEDKSASAIVKSVPQLSFVSQDTEPLEVTTIFRKGKKRNEYDLQGLHCVKQTSEKKKVRRLEKYKSKFLISAVPSP